MQFTVETEQEIDGRWLAEVLETSWGHGLCTDPPGSPGQGASPGP